MNAYSETPAPPLVSVVTPAFQQGRFIAATLASVRDQTYPNIEHIVIDGGSTDETVSILKSFEGSYALKWVSEPDDGQAAAVNKGVAMARGEIVGWLNSDDVYLFRDSLARMVEAYLKDRPDVLIGDMAFLDREGHILQFFGYRKPRYDRLLSGAYNPGQPSVLVKRSVFARNPLREDLHYTMDLELWLRLGRSCRVRAVREVFAGARMYPGAKSSTAAYDAEERAVRNAYGCTKRASRLEKRIANVYGLRLRGFWHLVACRYLRRQTLASRIRYVPPPLDFASQLFRKMRRDYSLYWPAYIEFPLRIFRAAAALRTRSARSQ